MANLVIFKPQLARVHRKVKNELIQHRHLASKIQRGTISSAHATHKLAYLLTEAEYGIPITRIEMTEEELRGYARQLMQAIHELHSRKIAHGDICCESVILVKGEVKL